MAGSSGVNAGRLRLGVALILLWWLPLWALGPWIASSIGGGDNSPSGAAVTAVIVVVQTIIGLLGFWVAGVEVKTILRHSTKRQAFKAAWSVLIRGRIPDPEPAVAPPDEHHPGSETETTK